MLFLYPFKRKRSGYFKSFCNANKHNVKLKLFLMCHNGVGLFNIDDCNLQHALLSVALDQILHGPRLIHQRRHSVSVCQTPVRTPAQDAFSMPSRAPQKKISVELDCEGDSPLSPLSSFDSPAVSICHFYPGPNADLRILVFCTWFSWWGSFLPT